MMSGYWRVQKPSKESGSKTPFLDTLLIAHRFETTHGMPVRRSAWYTRQQPTFSDALALVRSRLWQHRSFSMSGSTTDVVKISATLLDQLTEALCYAA